MRYAWRNFYGSGIYALPRHMGKKGKSGAREGKRGDVKKGLGTWGGPAHRSQLGAWGRESVGEGFKVGKATKGNQTVDPPVGPDCQNTERKKVQSGGEREGYSENLREGRDHRQKKKKGGTKGEGKTEIAKVWGCKTGETASSMISFGATKRRGGQGKKKKL